MTMNTVSMVVLATVIGGAAMARTIEVNPGPQAQEQLQTALIGAKPGDVVRLAPGRFDLTDGHSLDVARVTVIGAGLDKTVLAFDHQKGEAEGLLITSNQVVVRDLAIENARANGVKSKGVDQISLINLRAVWTGSPKATDGSYGVYPA